MENNIPQWHKLIFRPLTLEEKEFHPDWIEIGENLPNFNEDVFVTDGTDVWVDSFDEDDDGLWLSGTDNEIDVIVAWMEIPPYKEEQ